LNTKTKQLIIMAMAKDKVPTSIKKEISRLRSEVRRLQEVRKDINPFTGIVSGNYWTQTGNLL
ncbi:MAG: hypothetical protein KJ888_20200, partial [Gammaproteobacteria bacterium]|nr:hypothetical protein [Gammaproteobacteria bacterium]